MTFDTTTVLIIVAVLAAALILWLVLRSGRAPERVERRPEGETPYVARQDRPYVKPTPAAPAEPAPVAEPAPRRRDGPEGNSLADEYSAAATDVAGDVLGVAAHAELPGGTAPPDDLTLLKGVGPKFAARLNELGISRFDQIAAISENEVAILDDKLGPFKGRLARDRIVEQAGYLARGDREGFEERFGKLGG